MTADPTDELMAVHVPGTDPYPWPYDGRLGGDHLAVVLAGWDTGWSSRATAGGEHDNAHREASATASTVAGIGGLIVRLAHEGAEPLPLDVDATTVAVPGIDGFYASPLDDLLRTQRRTHLLIVGHGLEAAVHSTMRSANDRGYECLLVVDACSSLVADLTEASAKTVTMSGGIFGAIGTTNALLGALPEPTIHLVSSTPQEA